MIKIKFTQSISAIVLALALIAGAAGSASAADLNWSAATTVTIGSANYTVVADSAATSMTVGASTLTVTVPSGSTFTLLSSNRYPLDNSANISQQCSSTQNQLIVTGPLTSVIITPDTTRTCAVATSGGGGGGGTTVVTGPTNTSIVIDSGKASTTTASVVLTLAATGAAQMAISNTADFSGAVWETYATSKSWTLTSGDGVKTVYAKFKDASGNISTAVSDAITLSATPATTNVSASKSTVAVSPSSVVADGASTSTITVTIKDDSEAVLADKVVTVSGSRGINDTIPTVTKKTGADGIATFEIKSTTAGVSTITVMVGDLQLTAMPTVTFTSSVTGTPTTPASAVSYPDGTLLKSAADPKVYVIKNGEKVWIQTAAEFTKAGYKWTDIKTVSADVIKQVGAVTLVRAEGDPKVYVVKNNVKRHITSPAEFASAGYNWSDVQVVAKSQVDAYPTATAVIVKVVNTPTLRVRASNTTTSAILGKVSQNETFTVLEEKTGWYKIKTKTGVTGWISGAYATKQ